MGCNYRCFPYEEKCLLFVSKACENHGLCLGFMKKFRGIVLESGRGILDLRYNYGVSGGNYSIHTSSVFVWGMARLR